MANWYDDELKLKETRLVPFRLSWQCPTNGCDGEMKSTGEQWTTYPPGIHHRCDKCGREAVLSDKEYPCIVHREE